MNNLAYQILKTANSRLFYKELELFDSDWIVEKEMIRQMVLDSPSLKLASNDTFFYFFSDLTEESCAESLFWIGMDVIGHLELESESDLASYDLDGGEAYSFQLSIPFTELNWETLAILYREAKQKLALEQKTVAETWRLRFVTLYPEEERVEFKAYLEFFPQ